MYNKLLRQYNSCTVVIVFLFFLQSIWNFISEYPSQFNDLLNKEYPSLPSEYYWYFQCTNNSSLCKYSDDFVLFIYQDLLRSFLQCVMNMQTIKEERVKSGHCKIHYSYYALWVNITGVYLCFLFVYFHCALYCLQHILRDIAESGIDNSSGPHKAQVHVYYYAHNKYVC